MTISEYMELVKKLDDLYGELRGMYMRADYSVEDSMRAQLATMEILGMVLVHLNYTVR